MPEDKLVVCFFTTGIWASYCTTTQHKEYMNVQQSNLLVVTSYYSSNGYLKTNDEKYLNVFHIYMLLLLQQGLEADSQKHM